MDKEFVIRHSVIEANRIGGHNAVQEYVRILEGLNERERAIHEIYGLRTHEEGYIDEIPGKIVHSIDGKYKCRRGWFNGVFIRIENLKLIGLLSPELADRHSTLQDKLGLELQTRLTKKEDIDITNSLLRDTLAYLTSRFQITQQEIS